VVYFRNQSRYYHIKLKQKEELPAGDQPPAKNP
jgi:hypothetical protein